MKAQAPVSPPPLPGLTTAGPAGNNPPAPWPLFFFRAGYLQTDLSCTEGRDRRADQRPAERIRTRWKALRSSGHKGGKLQPFRLRELYRDMPADKTGKAAARTEPGTRWESLTGPHARLFICHEEIPADRNRTRRKALRVSGRICRTLRGH